MEFLELRHYFFSVQLQELNSTLTGLMVLYIGPETILPLTSFLAAVVGVLLMFWRYVVGVVKRSFHFCGRIVDRLFARKN